MNRFSHNQTPKNHPGMPPAFGTLPDGFSVSKNLVLPKKDEIPYLAPSDEGAVSEAD